MAAFEARHDVEIDPHLAVLLAVCAGAVNLHHLSHTVPPALWTGFPSIQRVWISFDFVAASEHTIVDGYHGLTAGNALGAHADNAAAWIASTFHFSFPLAFARAA